LIGENWWTNWPDELMDPADWVKGDVFDAVMHYQWFKLARGYFAKPNDKMTKSDFENSIKFLLEKYPSYTQQAMMNLASSHDSPRLLTSFFNINKYKYKCKPHEDHEYRTQKPGQITYHQVKLFLLNQFTFVGAPHIWNGDEMGMFGADDPDNRKPLVWKDIEFEFETESDSSSYTYKEKMIFDEDMFAFYKSIIELRKSSDAFSLGSLEFFSDLGKNVFAYYRSFEDEKYLIIINANLEPNTIFLPTTIKDYKMVFEYNLMPFKKSHKFSLSAYSGIVIKIII
jgi:glycosidase